MSLKVGDAAPDAVVTGPSGPVHLSTLFGKQTVVLFFYPKDETAGCTREACEFRDSHTEFTQAGAEVIGISTDSMQSHAGFVANHRLPYTLLSDPDGAAANAFGVKTLFGLLRGRVTFVIDKAGKVRLIFDSQLRVYDHAKKALALVKSLA